MHTPFVTEHCQISGTGACVPELVVTNEELAQSVDTSAEWVYEKLGILERRISAPSEFTSDLAVGAARAAIADAELDGDEIDLIILATATPDRLAPSTACLVQDRLGIRNGGPAFDVAAVCSGFIYAMAVANQFIHSGTCRHALVIGADTFSRITDWTRRDCVFFGDGAGAVVLSRVDEGCGFFSTILQADGRGKDNFTVYPGDRAFTMNGRAVFDTGSTVIPAALEKLLAHHDLRSQDISILVPHQPSIQLLYSAATAMGIPTNKVAMNMDRYANTSGATIPLLLDEVKKNGRLTANDLVAFAAVGSGWTWGAALYRWR